MNNVIIRKIDVTESYQPLAAGQLVASVTISAPPTNSGDVYFKADPGAAGDVAWIPGEWHDFRSVNLAEIEVKGTPGDTVTIVGGTW